MSCLQISAPVVGRGCAFFAPSQALSPHLGPNRPESLLCSSNSYCDLYAGYLQFRQADLLFRVFSHLFNIQLIQISFVQINRLICVNMDLIEHKSLFGALTTVTSTFSMASHGLRDLRKLISYITLRFKHIPQNTILFYFKI